jgi:alanine dehydrogenase
MEELTLGVVGTSRKENERRVPIHPDHLGQIAPALRERCVFERGYGEPFGTSDEELEAAGVGLAERAELLASAGVVLLPKPAPEDLEQLREGGILWGWPHCVQQREITQVAIDRRLTLIAWEAMFLWKGEVRDMHLFYRNNEMAGYCSVIHALACAGLDGHYGENLRTVVLSFGSVSRGAIRALRGRGIGDLSVFTLRPPWAVRDQVMGCRHGRMLEQGGTMLVEDEDGARTPLVDVLSEADVIVNGILQDTEHPIMFVRQDELERLKHGALIIDVSCDEGMGFPFARPTSFEAPVFRAGRVTYYGVDHSPSYLWRSASWELSRAVLPFVETVMGGPERWEEDETIARAIEIRAGCVLNERILSFQGRASEYPHDPLARQG